MGSWDCYCMFCSGPMSIYAVQVGDSRTEALTKRAMAVMERKKELASQQPLINTGYNPHGSPESPGPAEDVTVEADDKTKQDIKICGVFEDSDTDPLALDPSISPNHTLVYGTPQAREMDDYYEGSSYDPRLLTLESVKWLIRSRTLGYNEEATGLTKAFISGPGKYVDYGVFEILEAGNDVNDRGSGMYDCYSASSIGYEDATFPFHENCYKVFARCLGYSHPDKIDKDILFETVSKYEEGWGGNLQLDYGQLQSDQFWVCHPGEEYLVCNPGHDLELLHMLPDLLPSKVLTTLAPTDLSDKVRHDPFRVLPFDMVYNICQGLPSEDAIKLMQASHHVLCLTREPAFWKQAIRRHITPWFWEAEHVAFHHSPSSEINYKALYLWLDKVTKPTCGMEGPFMRVANRRRIWRACGQLAAKYNPNLKHAKATRARHLERASGA